MVLHLSLFVTRLSMRAISSITAMVWTLAGSRRSCVMSLVQPSVARFCFPRSTTELGGLFSSLNIRDFGRFWVPRKFLRCQPPASGRELTQVHSLVTHFLSP